MTTWYVGDTLEDPTTGDVMLRLWARRRRLLAASVALMVVLVPLLLLIANVNGPYVISPDYDMYDYDAVDGVHAMVHQMSHNKAKRDVIGIRFLRSKERIRMQNALHTYNMDDEDADDAFPRTGSVKSRRGGSKKGIFRRKIQDSDDVPPEEVKGYAFLHQRAFPVRVSTATSGGKDDAAGDNGGANNDEMYHASEDEDDYGVGDAEENPKDAMFEPQPDDDKDEDYREEDENAYDYWSRNPEFKPGDFDNKSKINSSKLYKPVLKYEEIPPKSGSKQPRRHLVGDSGVRPAEASLVRKSQPSSVVVVNQAENRLHDRGLPESVVEDSVNYETNNKDSKLRFVPNNCDPKVAGCRGNTRSEGPVNGARTRHTAVRRVGVGRRPVATVEQSEELAQQQQLFNTHKVVYVSKQQYRTHKLDTQQQTQRQASPPHHTLNRTHSSRGVPPVINHHPPRPNSLRHSLMGSLGDKGGDTGGGVEYAHRLPLHEQPATQLQVPQLAPQQGEVVSRAGFNVVRHRIHWSSTVEGFVTPGITDEDVAAFRHKVSRVAVAEMREPQWNRCGRPRNQYVVLEDGSALCARYRAPHTKMIQGEILSFYLARLLGIDSVPVSVLVQVNSSAPQWRHVTPSRAGWEDGQLVVFIQWIEGLDQIWSHVKMPALILSAYQTGVPVTRNHPALPTMSASELGELLQWSDMILFDYIIGHYDRVASMQDGAERENKPSIMSESIRNLRKVPTTNKLWFVDNESGLFDGYELMKYGRKNGPRFVKFHEQMLHTVCIFRESLVAGVEQLARHPDPQEVLTEFTQRRDPLYNKLPSVSKIKYFKQYFHSRLKEVAAWVEKCRGS